MKNSIKKTILVMLLTIPILMISSYTYAGVGNPYSYTLSADFDEGSVINVNHVIADQLQLKDTGEAFNFIWVAASGRGTIVKIDTLTGAILGEYKSAPDERGKSPSRTTVDANGNVWAGNRNESSSGKGSVVHIGLLENGQCVDRNDNGTIESVPQAHKKAA